MLRAMSTRSQALAAPGVQVAIALGVLYVVWGSTYLAIRVVVGTIPPFGSASVRFLIAGAILYLVAGRDAGGRLVRPGLAEWRDAAIIGGFLLVGGNGLVSLGETTVPSGIAALLIATMPIWVAILGRFLFASRLSRLTVFGIALGFVGVAILVWPTGDIGRIDPTGTAIVLCSPILWSIGSLYSRRARHPERPLVGVAMQMLLGGILLGLVAILTGEPGRLQPALVSTDSLVALGYLVVIGSLVGYTAYGWLLRVAPLSLIATYAYVNPIVAVLLGWAVLREPISPRTLVAGAVIVLAVAVIVWARGREPGAAPPSPEELVESS